MADNPWFVDSLQNFWHLKCPECTFDSKEEGTFKYHAVTKHPLSLVLFGKEFNYPVENPTTDLIKIEISKEETKPVDKSFVNENDEFNEEYDIDEDFDDNFKNTNEHTEIMENCTSATSLENTESNYVEEFTIKEEFSEVKSDAEEDQNNEEGSEPTKKRLKRNCHSSKISYEEEENSLPENNIESDETKNLIPHIESVHEKIKHPCSICDKILSSKKQLRYHIDGFHEGKTM